MSFKIQWIDRFREPRNQPRPGIPDRHRHRYVEKACKTDLPYPAKRVGHYVIDCETCGLRVAVTTAGRADDPRSVKVACKAGEPT